MARQARGPSAVARQARELSAAARVVRYWGGGDGTQIFKIEKKIFEDNTNYCVHFLLFCLKSSGTVPLKSFCENTNKCPLRGIVTKKTIHLLPFSYSIIIFFSF